MDIKYAEIKFKYYGTVQRILNDLTGITWGCIKDKSNIKYLTSDKILYRVGKMPKHHSKRLKLDIELKPSDSPDWVDYANVYIKDCLLELLTLRPQVIDIDLNELIAKINDYKVNKKLENIYKEAGSVDGTEIDPYEIVPSDNAWIFENKDCKVKYIENLTLDDLI